MASRRSNNPESSKPLRDSVQRREALSFQLGDLGMMEVIKPIYISMSFFGLFWRNKANWMKGVHNIPDFNQLIFHDIFILQKWTKYGFHDTQNILLIFFIILLCRYSRATILFCLCK